ncbi:unnamed protein product [Prunus armeniaca]|uniref:Uncharacterized protein n=1 Tax=Prunus armeniaca TaxID=36596 RepID=A0A6J5VXC3_PRUAR|nr:unnamed protein product [Prunus armeniaca]
MVIVLNRSFLVVTPSPPGARGQATSCLSATSYCDPFSRRGAPLALKWEAKRPTPGNSGKRRRGLSRRRIRAEDDSLFRRFRRRFGSRALGLGDDIESVVASWTSKKKDLPMEEWGSRVGLAERRQSHTRPVPRQRGRLAIPLTGAAGGTAQGWAPSALGSGSYSSKIPRTQPL